MRILFYKNFGQHLPIGIQEDKKLEVREPGRIVGRNDHDLLDEIFIA
jgi:hypothetical protein